MKHVHTCDFNIVNRFQSQIIMVSFFFRTKCTSSIDALNDGNDENGTFNVAENQKKKHTSAELSITYRFRACIRSFIRCKCTTDFTDGGIVKGAQNIQKEGSKQWKMCTSSVPFLSKLELLLIISPFIENRNNR